MPLPPVPHRTPVVGQRLPSTSRTRPKIVILRFNLSLFPVLQIRQSRLRLCNRKKDARRALRLRPRGAPLEAPATRIGGSGSRPGSSSPATDWYDAKAPPARLVRGSDLTHASPAGTSVGMRTTPARPRLQALPGPVRRWVKGSGTRRHSIRAGRSQNFGTPRGGRRTVPIRKPSPGFRGVPSLTMKMAINPPNASVPRGVPGGPARLRGDALARPSLSRRSARPGYRFCGRQLRKAPRARIPNRGLSGTAKDLP